MTDQHRDGAPLDELLADLPVGTAPVETMVRDGRVRRNRRRVAALAVVGAVVSVAMVAGLTSVGSDRGGPADPDAERLDVEVRHAVTSDMNPVHDPVMGFAHWDPEQEELTYVSSQGWTGECLPEATATEVAGRISLTISAGPPIACDMVQSVAAVVVAGITTRPNQITVAEAGETTTVPVTEVGDTADVLVVTSLTPDQTTMFFEGAVTEVALTSPTSIRPTPSEDGEHAIQQRWLDLEPGPYVLAASTRSCSGSCDSLDPPTDTCTQDLDLIADVVVRIEVTYGLPCAITVESVPATATDEQPVSLISSGWVPGQGGDGALLRGVLDVDEDDCVRIGTDPVAWPEGWTASVDRERMLRLRDAAGEVVATSGEEIAVGGGFSSGLRDDHPCSDRRARELFLVQSEVEVVGDR